MTIDERVRDQKLPYNIYGETTKTSTLSSGKLKNTNIVQGKKYYLKIKID